MKKKGIQIILWIAAAGVVIAASLWFRGCQQTQVKQQTQEVFHEPFQANATIEGESLSLNAKIGSSGKGEVSLEVCEPSPLAGMTFLLKDEAVTVSYGNMSFPVDLSGVPQSAVMKPLLSMLAGGISVGDAEVTRKDGVTTLKGTCDAGEYTISFDETEQKVLCVDFPQIGFRCDFSSFVKETAAEPAEESE